jgi:hypothetical protein
MTDLTGASLVARLEALQQLWRQSIPTIDTNFGCEAEIAATTHQTARSCADALDPILAELRRLQVQEKTEDKDTRVDKGTLRGGLDLSQRPTEVITPITENDILKHFDESRSPDGDGPVHENHDMGGADVAPIEPATPLETVSVSSDKLTASRDGFAGGRPIPHMSQPTSGAGSEPADSHATKVCNYEMCGCSKADDGHCMLCCKPLSDHSVISKRELEEIEQRLQFYSAERDKAEAALAASEARIAELCNAHEAEHLRADAAEAQLGAIEEREAACCPEDVGFDEWIRTLKKQLAASEARQQEMKAELMELNTLADTYATQHGGYVGNAKGVLLALLERADEALCEFCQRAEPPAMHVCSKCWNSANNDTWQRRAIQAEAEVSDLRAQIARLVGRLKVIRDTHARRLDRPRDFNVDYQLGMLQDDMERAARVPPPQDAAPQ